MARVSQQERSRQFVEAAARVIAQEGEAAATTRRIAAEAGAPLAALHYCFRSKDELLEAVYDHLSRDYARELPPLDEDLTLGETVRAHMHRVWERMKRSPYEQVTTIDVLLRAQRMDDGAKREKAVGINRRMYAGWTESTARIFAEAAARHELTPVVPVHEVAAFAVAGIDGISLQMLADPQQGVHDELVDRLCEVLTVMLTGRMAVAP